MRIFFHMLLPRSCPSKWYQWLRIWLSRNIRFVGVNVGMSARNRHFQTNYWCITILFLKVICQISRSHGSKKRQFYPNWAFPDCSSNLSSPMGTQWCTKLEVASGALLLLAATKQLYDWFSPSVRLSVCVSVGPSHLFHHVPIIVSSCNFQELLPMTKVTSMQKVKVRGQRTRSQRSTPNLTVSGL